MTNKYFNKQNDSSNHRFCCFIVAKTKICILNWTANKALSMKGSQLVFRHVVRDTLLLKYGIGESANRRISESRNMETVWGIPSMVSSTTTKYKSIPKISRESPMGSIARILSQQCIYWKITNKGDMETKSSPEERAYQSIALGLNVSIFQKPNSRVEDGFSNRTIKKLFLKRQYGN